MPSKLEKLEGFLAIPHELLHVVGYRLVGKKCSYRLGKLYVLPSGAMTRRERLIGLLFPFVIFCTIFLLTTFGVAVGVTYYDLAKTPWWVLVLFVLAIISGIYTFFSTGDLRQAYLLLHKKPLRSRTPFDFLWAWQEDLQKADPQLILMLLALSALTLSLLLLTMQD
jgi:hypothetical protein